MVQPVNPLSTALIITALGTLSVANAVFELVQEVGGAPELRCWSAINHNNLVRLQWTRIHNDTYSTSMASLLAAKTKQDESETPESLPWDVEPVNRTLRVKALPKDGSLQITDAIVGDSGTYECQGYVESPVDGGEKLVFTDLTKLKVGHIPNKPPGQPELQVVDAYSLKVKWQQPTRQEGEIIPTKGYIILVSQTESNRGIAHKNTTMYTWDKAIKMEVNATVSALISGLRPHTFYKVSVQSKNAIGVSDRSDPSEARRTLEAAPEGIPRVNLGVKNYTNAIYLEILAPDPLLLNGDLMGYDLLYGVQGALSTIGKSLQANITFVNITGLQPFMTYTIKLRYYNTAGEGPWLEVKVTTMEGVPGQPFITNVRNQTHNSLQVEWHKPKAINGVLTGYILSYHHNNTTQYEDYSEPNHMAAVKHTITNLKPYMKYDLRVAARTQAGLGPYSDVHPGYTDVEGPSAPATVNLTTDSSDCIKVSWSRPETFFGQIDLYRVKYWRNDTSEEKHAMVLPVADMSTDRQNALIVKLTTNKLYVVQVAGATKSIFVEKNPQFITGKYSEPKMISLKDSSISTSSTPPPSYSELRTFGYIAGAMATVVIIVIGIIIFIVTRRCLRTRYQFLPGKADGNNSSPNANNIPLPEPYIVDEQKSVSVENWSTHVMKLHVDTNLGFAQEYDDVNNKTRGDLTAKHSTAPDNEQKNRYLNIVAYDNSRVVLKPLAGKSRHTDYINANYIDGYKKPRAYIATQGPLTCTSGDFWRMIWEQRSAVIMMITKLTERGRRKCDQYWPSEADHSYGHFTVRLVSVHVTAHYTVRVFGLRHSREKSSNIKRVNESITNILRQKSVVERTVTQYHYTDWPDHGVPEYTLSVLKFVRKSMAANPDDAGPIVLHCSAGVGRTGTCIVIDAMIKQIQDKGSINVIGYLMHIRNQRNYLVQTEDQYVFIHDALLEYIQSGDTEVSSSEIGQFVETLKRNNAAQGDTLLQRLYKLVTAFKPDQYDLSSALLEVNAGKNRSKHILPVESSQVHLPAKPGVEGSNYINATHLMGYNKNNEFIVTQHPVTSTTDDFWRLVWDQNSMTIVLLSVIDEECTEFWPKGEESMDGGHFKVTSLTEESSHESYTTRDFLLQSTQDDYECTTSIIAVSNWPNSCSPLSSVFDLVRNVKNRHHEVEGPVIVVDKFGGTAAAKFCALVTLHDQLMQSDMVDPYMTAKLYHLERPGVFPTEEDFLFLYETIASICDEKHLLSLTMGSVKDSVIMENNRPNSLTRSISRLSSAVHETPM